MLKKMFWNLAFILVVFLAASVISACCSPAQRTVTVIFKDVDPDMGVTDYSYEVDFSEMSSLEFIIPEGYDHDGISAKAIPSDDKDNVERHEELECVVTLLDSDVGKEYEYSTDKTININLGRINKDIDVVIEMKTVRVRQFDIDITNEFAASIKKGNGTLSAVTVTPESVNHLVKIDSTNTICERNFENNKVTVNYGEYVVICYHNESIIEVPTIYSTVNHFTSSDRISSIGKIDYSFFNIAQKGNSYYNIQRGNNVDTNSRLYYIGMIQEPITLYDSIPEYEEDKGFAFSDSENIFKLVTNKQDWNSDLLTIDIFAPTTDIYDVNNEGLDRVEDTTIKKIEKYDDEGKLKEEDLLYEYLNRYDVYNMYIGNNKKIDKFLTTKEKEILPECFYISVKTEDYLKDYLNFNLLYYENQFVSDIPYETIDYSLTSTKNRKLIKIDKEVIEKFLITRSVVADDENYEYQMGNCIFYVEIDKDLINDRKDHGFPYYTFTYTSLAHEYSYDYSGQVYIVNEDGSRDYGFVDLHWVNVDKESYKLDRVLFRVDKLYETNELGEFTLYDNNGNLDMENGQNYKFLKGKLFVDVFGPESNNYLIPRIEKLSISSPSANLIDSLITVQDSHITGVEITKNKETLSSLWQRKMVIEPILTQVQSQYKSIDMTSMGFSNQSEAIYMTNNINFEDDIDFTGVDSLTKFNETIEFGLSKDIYYFTVSESENFEFDVYVNYDGDSASKDEVFCISETKQLYDIAGNKIQIQRKNGERYDVKIKYLKCSIYNIDSMLEDKYYAFTKR